MKKFNNVSTLLGVSKTVLVFLFLLVVGVTPLFAHRSPALCTGSGLGINLYTDVVDVHLGDYISYSMDVFNGTNSPGVPIACDATDVAVTITTPNNVVHNLILSKGTDFSNGDVNSYGTVARYKVNAEDIQADKTLLATAEVTGTIHQNDSNSTGGGFQGVNTTVSIPAVLHVVKQVVNDNSGNAVASDFNLHVKSSGADVAGSPAVGVVSPGTSYSLLAGTYTVSEDAFASYNSSFSGDCNSGGIVTLVAGDDKTCTIINDDIIVVISGGGGGSYYPPIQPPIIVAPVIEDVVVPVIPIIPIVPTIIIPTFPKTGFSSFFDIILDLLFKDKVDGSLGQTIASATILYNQEQTELPFRLKIPNIEVDATVEHVGLTSKGAMDAPKGPANVGWFNLGPRPGDVGSSVIDGHSGYKNNVPAVFDNLYKLKKGDKIYIEDSEGETLTFVVRKLQIYNPKADTKDVFTSNDGKAHLNLITCTGPWNKIIKSHSERLVVFADMEIE